MDFTGGMIELYAGVILLMLFSGIVLTPHYRYSKQKMFALLLLFSSVSLILDGWNFLSPIGSDVYVITSLCFRVRYYAMLGFAGVYIYESLREEGTIWKLWPMFILPFIITGALVYMIAGLVEFGILPVSINADTLQLCCDAGDYVILSCYLFLILSALPMLQTGKLLALLGALFFPFAAEIVEIMAGIPYSYMTSYTLSMIVLYTFDYNVSQWQYVRRLASVADQQTEMFEQGIKLDFILDSLENIEELAIEDPLRSGLEAKGLREYITHTFEAMREVKLVAFSRELSVIKQMVKLENLKQPDDRQIQAEYNIEISSFKVPSLSIRMLTENAISSLLASSQENRKLVISTREYGEYYEIEIKDNGLLEPEGDEAIGTSYLAAKDLATRQLLEFVDAEVKELPSFRKGKILHIILPKKSG